MTFNSLILRWVIIYPIRSFEAVLSTEFLQGSSLEGSSKAVFRKDSSESALLRQFLVLLLYDHSLLIMPAKWFWLSLSSEMLGVRCSFCRFSSKFQKVYPKVKEVTSCLAPIDLDRKCNTFKLNDSMYFSMYSLSIYSLNIQDLDSKYTLSQQDSNDLHSFHSSDLHSSSALLWNFQTESVSRRPISNFKTKSSEFNGSSESKSDYFNLGAAQFDVDWGLFKWWSMEIKDLSNHFKLLVSKWIVTGRVLPVVCDELSLFDSHWGSFSKKKLLEPQRRLLSLSISLFAMPGTRKAGRAIPIIHRASECSPHHPHLDLCGASVHLASLLISTFHLIASFSLPNCLFLVASF